MFYEFKTEDVYRFADHVGARTTRRGKELFFDYCPRCGGGKSRDKKTFSINTTTGQFECKRASCSYHGNMLDLVRDFDFEVTPDVTRYLNLNNFNGKFKKFKEGHRDTTDAAIEYLKSRGIDTEVAKRYEVTTKKDAPEIMVFPFKDENGVLRFIKYRNLEFKKGESYGAKEWCEANCMPILFGMYQCNLDNKTLIITEGQIDSLSVVSAGYENAVSVPTGKNGFTWVPHCWNWLENFSKIIVFGDYENESMTLLSDLQKKMNAAIYHVRFADYMDCKDANEILQKYGAEQIKVCIDNAIPVPVEGLVDLATVKPINSYEVEKLPSGIGELDRILYGGLPFGGVTDITGKAGEGKSTIASQIIASAIDNNYCCFVYSGELSNASFKEGLDRQLSGTHVQSYEDDTQWHNTRYRIPDDIQERLNEWYKGRCFIYDSFQMAAQGVNRSLCDVIEEAIKRYETRVILIDNLMTALDLESVDGTDKWERQSLFMKKLVALAIKYNVLILLVAHNRKSSTENQNDNISGTADIGNLAMVTLDFGKSTDTKREISENQRILRVGKNRLFGRVNANGWVITYDEASRRLYATNADRDRVYSWESEMFVPVTDLSVEQAEIPF